MTYRSQAAEHRRIIEAMHERHLADIAARRSGKTYEDKVWRWIQGAKRLRDEIAQEASDLGLPGLAFEVKVLVDGRLSRGLVEPRALANAVKDRVYMYDARREMAQEWFKKQRARRLAANTPLRGSIPVRVDSRMRPVAELAAAVPTANVAEETHRLATYTPEATEWKR